MSIKILKVAYRPFKCANCGHVQPIQTNHEGTCIDHCKNCSWMMYGKPGGGVAQKEHCIPFGNYMYRPFAFSGKSGETSYGQ